MKIHLTSRDISSGATRAMEKFEKADTNDTKVVYPREVNKFSGKGAAQLKKVYAYARHVEGGTEGDDFVRLSTIRSSLRKLANGLKNVAKNKGSKDNVLDGNEIKLCSTAGASLARFIHATKGE